MNWVFHLASWKKEGKELNIKIREYFNCAKFEREQKSVKSDLIGETKVIDLVQD